MDSDKPACAVVLGGYINGYSIVRELFEKRVEHIIVLDTTRGLATYSNKITSYILSENTPDGLLTALDNLHKDYSFLVLFPTNDLYLENIHKIVEKIDGFCFIPFNEKNLPESLNKNVQYAFCEKLGVPYPKTILLARPEDLDTIRSVRLPLIIKPNRRDDLKGDVFRNVQVYTMADLEKILPKLNDYLQNGQSFLVSEIIPGDGSNIYAYVGYRTKNGNILNEWTGKKLAQFPNEFGVFASASNQAPDEVLQQGRTLLEGMDLTGIVEPEFKYDSRDNKYKLMEINLRSMMWHRAGNLSGVNLQYSQFLDATGKEVPRQHQVKNRDIHFVFFKHEAYNLLTRKGYFRTFRRNLFNSDETHYAVFQFSDILPAFADIKNSFFRLLKGDLQ